MGKYTNANHIASKTPKGNTRSIFKYSLIGLGFLIIAGLISWFVIAAKISEKFESNMNKLSLYHLHGCPHCVALMPVWNRLKKKYGANMAEYEANANPNLMNSKGIHSYPTILFGDKHYKGDRSYKDLESFLLNNLNK